jgi:methyl-accepting chemotaxis protein
MKIGKRMAILMSGIALLGMAVLAGGIVFYSYRQTRALMTENALELAQKNSAIIKDSIDRYMYQAQLIGEAAGQFDLMPVETRRAFLDTLLKGATLSGSGFFAAFKPDALGDDDNAHINHYINTPTGRYVTGFTLNPDKTFAEVGLTEVNGQDWYDNTISTGQQFLGNPYSLTVAGKAWLITTLAVPIMNKDRTVGVCGTGIELTFIQKLLSAIDLPEGGTAAVISTNGTMVGTTSLIGVENATANSVLGKPLRDIAGDAYGSALTQLLNAVKNGQAIQYTAKGTMFFNEPFQIGSAPEKWSINIGIPVAHVMAPVYAMLRIAIGITVVVLLAMIAEILVIARSISAPMGRTAAMLKSIFDNGACDLTKTVNESSKDEIGDLANYINQTLSLIRNMARTVKKEANGLTQLGNDLANNMTETAAAVNQITTTVISLKDKALNQNANVEETSAALARVTHEIEKVNDIVVQQTEQVSCSSAAITEMIKNIAAVAATLEQNIQGVNELSTAAGVGRQSLNEVTEDIREIAKESQGLMEINAVIDNIASKTNLLSMNAAIEAAHAGESGKGFAVVADEIRKLAENSSEQSKTIGAVLKRITDSITKINKSTENVLTNFDTIEGRVKAVSEQTNAIRASMDEQNEGSKQVLTSISNLNELARNVSEGSAVIMQSSQQVLAESHNIAAITSDMTNGMNEMVTGANQINDAIAHVNDLSAQNKTSIATVAREAAKFKVD